MGKYLLGLDAGNTVIKAVLFDLKGNQIAVSQENGATLTPQPGHVERDLNELWSQSGVAIRSCLEKAAIDPREIVGIGCAGHGNGLYLLDQEQKPLLAIQSLDNRAAAIAKNLDHLVGDRLYDICLQRPWSSQTPTLLAWVKQYKPDLYSKIGTAFLCKDYVNYKLTDVISSDKSDMAGCGFLQMPDCSYSDELLEVYGLADAKKFLPSLFHSAEIVGQVSAEAAAHTGLFEGTAVIAGAFDVVASALGSGTVKTGQASVIVGTWSINQVIVEELALDGDIFMCCAFDEKRFLEIESSATSAVNLEWFVHELMGSDIDRLKGTNQTVFDLCNELIATVDLVPDLPIFHPYIYSGATSSTHKGGFYGLCGWQGRAHMLYSLFEGVAFGHKQHIEKLYRNGIDIKLIILSGGGSRSLIWPQLFADVLGVEVSVAKAEETGALGSAIAAGVGVGLLKDYADGVEQMTNLKQIYQPNTEKAQFYSDRYARFLKIADAMASVWED